MSAIRLPNVRGARLAASGDRGGGFFQSCCALGKHDRRRVDLWLYPVLFLTAIVAGAVDAIAGGGGLLTVPALLWAGLPVPLALGTNKLQSSCGTAIATWRYAQAGWLKLPALGWGIAATLVGAVVGVASVSHLDPAWLRRLLPGLLVAVALYFWWQPQRGERAQSPRLPANVFAVVAGLVLGFYDGFFGPGTGSFWMMAGVGLMGFDLRQATGWTKAMNLTSNLASLACFLALGQVHWGIGFTMAAGQMIGAQIGTRLALRRGAGLIRPVFLVVVILLATKLLLGY